MIIINSFTTSYRPTQTLPKSSAPINPLSLNPSKAVAQQLFGYLNQGSANNLGPFASKLQGSVSLQADKNANDPTHYDESTSQIEGQQETYIDILAMNSRFAAFSPTKGDGVTPLTDFSTAGQSLLYNAIAVQGKTPLQKLTEFVRNTRFQNNIRRSPRSADNPYGFTTVGNAPVNLFA